MHRCFASPEHWSGERVHLDAGEAHHLARVLRLASGDTVEVFDGAGRHARAVIVCASGRTGMELRLVEPPTAADPPLVDLLLIQAVPKADRMDWIIEKAVELGVAAIQPVYTDRTVRRGHTQGAERRLERWARIAREAAKQCGAFRIPDVRAGVKYETALHDGAHCELFVVGALGPGRRPIGAVADEAASRGLRSAALLIGPEGDLTSDELRRAEEAGAVPVTFGRQVLRVETAAVFGVSVLMSAWLTRDWAGGAARQAQGTDGRAPSPDP